MITAPKFLEFSRTISLVIRKFTRNNLSCQNFYVTFANVRGICTFLPSLNVDQRGSHGTGEVATVLRWSLDSVLTWHCDGFSSAQTQCAGQRIKIGSNVQKSNHVSAKTFANHAYTYRWSLLEAQPRQRQWSLEPLSVFAVASRLTIVQVRAA